MDLIGCSIGDTSINLERNSKSLLGSLRQLTWNIDVSRTIAKELTTIRYFCKDDKCRIVHSVGKRIGDVSMLVVKAIAGHDAVRMVVQFNMDNLLMENCY